MRPNDLATKLVGKGDAVTYGKQVRARLREWYPRDDSLKNASWTLSPEQIAAVTAWHNARKSGKSFAFGDWRKTYRARARKPKATETPTA